MSSIIDCENRIAEIFKKRNDEKQILREGIKAMEEEIAGHNAQMVDATGRGDEEAYSRAKRAREASVDALEMRSTRLAQLDEKPLITKEEYLAMAEAIVGECRGMVDADKKKVVALVDQIRDIANSEKLVLQRANVALHELQENVYRNVDRPRFPNGSFYPGTEKRVNDFSVCEYASVITGSGYYARFKGEDPSGPRPVVVSSEEAHRRYLEGLTEDERKKVLKAEADERKAKKGGIYGIW